MDAHFQSQTSHVKSAPTGRGEEREPPVKITQLHVDPVLTVMVSAKIDHLGLPSSDFEDEDRASNKKSTQGKKLQSGKTAKLTNRVIAP